MTALAPTLQAFFTERLIGQRQASPHTINAYRDTFRLLLIFTQQQTGIAPHKLHIEDVDSLLITAFLDHLEHDRGNSPRTRNHRLAAIRSLYHYAALRHPEHAATIARVLAIPAPSAMTAGSSAISPSPRPRRYSQHPIAASGSAAVTTR